MRYFFKGLNVTNFLCFHQSLNLSLLILFHSLRHLFWYFFKAYFILPDDGTKFGDMEISAIIVIIQWAFRMLF